MATDLWDAKPCVLVHGYQSFGGKFSLLLQGGLSRYPADGGSRTLETLTFTHSTWLKAANPNLTVLFNLTPTQFSQSTVRAATDSACKERISDIIQRM